MLSDLPPEEPQKLTYILIINVLSDVVSCALDDEQEKFYQSEFEVLRREEGRPGEKLLTAEFEVYDTAGVKKPLGTM